MPSDSFRFSFWGIEFFLLFSFLLISFFIHLIPFSSSGVEFFFPRLDKERNEPRRGFRYQESICVKQNTREAFPLLGRWQQQETNLSMRMAAREGKDKKGGFPSKAARPFLVFVSWVWHERSFISRQKSFLVVVISSSQEIIHRHHQQQQQQHRLVGSSFTKQ